MAEGVAGRCLYFLKFKNASIYAISEQPLYGITIKDQ